MEKMKTVESWASSIFNTTRTRKSLSSVTPNKKTGKWKKEDGCEGACDGYMSAGVICSQCGEIFCSYIGNYDFCPNCGDRKVSE